jgi:simple sugar transport system ATP-binding protein
VTEPSARGPSRPETRFPELELQRLTVRYGSVTALSRVSATLPAGKITCVLGENGSGKSTLVAVLSGLRRHDEGHLLLAGAPVHFRSPRQARAAGIATVWQDLAVAPLLSIWRNFFLGAEPTRGVWPMRRLDVDRARETTVHAMARVGVTGVDPDQPASTLQAGERQSLAIARAMHFGARALVIDEPTAPLTVAQQTLLLQAIVAARSQGLAVLLVTNNPRYAHLVGDRFLLLAHGQVAGTLTRDDVDASDLMRLMAGGEEFSALTSALTALHSELGDR